MILISKQNLLAKHQSNANAMLDNESKRKTETDDMRTENKTSGGNVYLLKNAGIIILIHITTLATGRCWGRFPVAKHQLNSSRPFLDAFIRKPFNKLRGRLLVTPHCRFCSEDSGMFWNKLPVPWS